MSLKMKLNIDIKAKLKVNSKLDIKLWFLFSSFFLGLLSIVKWGGSRQYLNKIEIIH